MERSRWVRDKFLHQVKEFKYHRVLLNEGRVEQEICSVLCDDVDAVPDSCGEERAECGIKVHDLRVNVCTYPHLWPRALGSD